MNECGSVVILVSNKCASTDAPFALRQTILAQLTMSCKHWLGWWHFPYLWIGDILHSEHIHYLCDKEPNTRFGHCNSFHLHLLCLEKAAFQRDLQYPFIPTLHTAFAAKCQPFSVRGESQEPYCDLPIAQSAALMLACSTAMFFLKNDIMLVL